MKLLFLLASLVTSNPAAPPKGWIEVPPPATEKQWRCANLSAPEQSVSGQASMPLRIAEEKSQGQPARRLSLADGTMFGSNNGEWGGKIEWLPNGTSKRQLVAEANTIELLERGGEVFALTGLAHLGSDEGKLLRLRRAGKSWSAVEVLDLGTAPYASYRIDQDGVLLASGKGVALLDLSTPAIKSLHDNPGWWGIYPNSLRPFGEAIALGVRGAVIMLRREGSGYREYWWVPVQCRLPGESCPCSMLPEDLQ